MKTNTLYILVFAFALALVSCKDEEAGTGAAGGPEKTVAQQVKEERLAFNKRLYDQAKAQSDYYTQIVALNALMLDDSANTAVYTDSLSKLYATIGLAKAAGSLADKVLQDDPESVNALELKMELSLSKGNFPEAMNILRKLYEKTNEVKYLFTMAEIHMQENKIGEVEKILKQIEKNPQQMEASVDFTDPTTGRRSMLPVKAAIPYMRAIIALNQSKVRNAETYLQQAIKAYPDFDVAKQALRQIQKERENVYKNLR